MIWIDSLIRTDRGNVKLRDLTPEHRIITLRGYVPLHSIRIPDASASPAITEAKAVAIFTTKSYSNPASVVLVSPDHPVSIVRPDENKPVLVQADCVRTNHDLITLTKYHRPTFVKIDRIEHTTAALGNVYLDDPYTQKQSLFAYHLFVSGIAVGLDTCPMNLELLDTAVSPSTAIQEQESVSVA